MLFYILFAMTWGVQSGWLQRLKKSEWEKFIPFLHWLKTELGDEIEDENLCVDLESDASSQWTLIFRTSPDLCSLASAVFCGWKRKARPGFPSSWPQGHRVSGWVEPSVILLLIQELCAQISCSLCYCFNPVH